MSPQESYVSVIEPISPAIERVKTVLFRPFDLGRWFIIGFCAWLAGLERLLGGDGGGRSRVQFKHGPTNIDDIRYQYDQAKDFVMVHPWVLPAAVGALVLAAGTWLLITWLSSRGRFMFLHCVAQNRAEVRNPWHQFRAHANSLFGFRIVVGILCIVAVLGFIAPVFVTLIVLKMTIGSTVLAILGAAVYVLSFVTLMVLFAIIGKFTRDFVVPIMYLHGVSCRQAWATLLDLLGVNKMRFLLYLLFQFVIGVAITTIVFGLTCATCGCACCFFALPYIGTVALLPILVFLRAYSLYYLAQYAPELNVFLPVSPPASPGPQAMA